MSLRDHARHHLNFCRKATEMIFAEFKNEEDWFRQPTENANHALWIMAHLGLADNHFAASFRPEVDSKPEGWEELFWFGSEIQADRSVYPAVDEVRAYFEDRRRVLLQVLDDLSDEEFNAAAPPEGEQSMAAGAPSKAFTFFFGGFHEGIHMGQLTVCHRALGHDPIMKPESAQTA